METLISEEKAQNEQQVVSFQLGHEEFGVDILLVQEINRMLNITRLPQSPDFVEGVINLRGRVIPVINLRKRFRLADKESDKNTRIVVVNVENNIIGLVVDSVSEVLRLPSDTIEPAPPMVSGAGSEYIKGVGKRGKTLLILLDLNRLLSSQEWTQLKKVIT